MAASVKKKQYDIEYAKTHLKRVPLDLRLDKYDEIKAHAESRSESINGFIKRAIDETMERDEEDDGDSQRLLAWDPDFTKVTPKERRELEEAEADPELIDMDAINWD